MRVVVRVIGHWRSVFENTLERSAWRTRVIVPDGLHGLMEQRDGGDR
jgi:hypothetical protein